LFSFTSIDAYHRQLVAGQTSCVQAVTHYAAQIESHHHLNAFVRTYIDEALEKARVLDAQRAKGAAIKRLHGVVIGIKDVLCYEGHPVSASSHMLSGFTAIYNATVVERLLQEDAIIIGHQNCDEFAMGSSNENSYYGPVQNAADTSRVPGGSSGGSAVAVQAGLCMVSLGSDTGGSVRQPSDFCGVTGFKPGYGRVSRYGLIAYASSFDQVGILSSTVADAAIVLGVIAGKDAFDTTLFDEPVPDYTAALAKGNLQPRVAYFKQATEHASIDKEIRQAQETYLAQLREKGYVVEAVDFPLIDYLVPAYYILTTAEASSNLNRYDGVKFGYRTKGHYQNLVEFYKKNRSEGFGKEVQRRIMLGTFVLSAGYYDAYYTKAQQVRRKLFDFTQNLFQQYDFVLMPNSPVTAFKTGEKTADPMEMYLADIYTVFANLVGIPAISLPLFRHSNGMPFGVQVLANHRQEAALLAFSHTLMTENEVLQPQL
jgi:aspartyl-tRNA(Asn)/glutamyl-tRNA(Gln) amidotransferase subunit A